MCNREVTREGDPRSRLRASRTEIAMAIDDPFPLLYGLADHDIITDQQFKVLFIITCIPSVYQSVFKAKKKNYTIPIPDRRITVLLIAS